MTDVCGCELPHTKAQDLRPKLRFNSFAIYVQAVVRPRSDALLHSIC
jgi:hypothetical protein